MSVLILMFGLWINSQVSLNVSFIDATPTKQVGNVLSESTQGAKLLENDLISKTPITFSNASYQWNSPRAERVAKMENLVSDELVKYSSKYLDSINLNEIILVSDIKTRNNTPVLGFTDPLRGQIYLNAIDISSEESRNVVARMTVHHEIAHLLAYKNYGYWFDRDSGWSKLENLGDYGTIPGIVHEYFPKAGYVSRYAMTSAGEDFAEVYGLAFTDYYQQLLDEKLSKDSVIRQKVQFVYDSIAKIDRDQCRQAPVFHQIECAE